MTPNGETERWVKYHVRCLRPESTLRSVRRADRATFLDYVALARWQEPYRGCLCEEDGKPWGRKKRADLVGESYGVIKRTEEALQDAGLITFQQRGVQHKNSAGRLHITKYDDYQARYGGSRDEDQNPSEMKADGGNPSRAKDKPFASEGLNPSEMKARHSDEEPFGNEGHDGERPREAGLAEDAVSQEKGSGNEGQPTVDVIEYDLDHDDESLRGEVEQQLSLVGVSEKSFEALWAGLRSMNVPHFESVVLEAAITTVQWALGVSNRPNPQAVATYMRKTLRTQAEEETERAAMHDDLDRQHIRLLGPRPRNAHWREEQRWDDSLREFRADQELWLYRRCGDGHDERIRQRAEDLGLWDDGLVERVRQRIIDGECD